MSKAHTSANTSARTVEAIQTQAAATAERGRNAGLFLSKAGRKGRRADRQNVRASKRAWLDS